MVPDDILRGWNVGVILNIPGQIIREFLGTGMEHGKEQGNQPFSHIEGVG
jgi:hypothetical protein